MSLISVVIVDDNEADAALLQRLLKKLPQKMLVTIHEDNEQLAKTLEKNSPELVFVDYYLGILKGTDLIKEHLPQFPHTAFVLNTNRGDEEVVSEALRSGATDYFRKDHLNTSTLKHLVERVLENQQQKAILQRQAEIIAATSDIVICSDAQGFVQSLNPAGRQLLRMTVEEKISGMHMQDVHPKDMHPIFQDTILPALKSQSRWQGELVIQDLNGKRVPVSMVSIALKNTAGEIESFANIMRDISYEKDRENHLYYSAHHDSLTGLPNRRQVLLELKRNIETARRNKTQLALVFLDLDHFKGINDTLGHEAGDQLLQIVARRLSSTTRSSDLVARLGETNL